MTEVFGLDVADLPEDFYPTGLVMIVRGVDMSDGTGFTATRITHSITPAEVIGLSWTLHEDSKMQMREWLSEES